MIYAGFWPRFAALLLDSLIVDPVFLLVWWGGEHWRLFNLYYFLPGLAFGLFYSVYLVRRFGGTPGKRLMKVLIRKVDGSPVGYREALLRYLPEFVLGATSGIASIVAVLHLTDAEYSATSSFMERSLLVTSAQPGWAGPVTVVSSVWIWGELIVLMTNRKRRALHDFIAGTVVVRDGSDQGMQLTAPQSGLPMSVATTFNLRSGPPPAAVADPGVSFGLGRGIVIYRSL